MVTLTLKNYFGWVGNFRAAGDAAIISHDLEFFELLYKKKKIGLRISILKYEERYDEAPDFMNKWQMMVHFFYFCTEFSSRIRDP